MGGKLRSTLPVLPSNFEPSIPNYSQLQHKETHIGSQQKANYDSRHCSRNSVKLLPGDDVYIEDGYMSTEGQIMQEVAPRSYQVSTPQGIRRNRKHLRLLPTTDTTDRDHESEQVVPDSEITVTRSGRVSQKPLCYRL